FKTNEKGAIVYRKIPTGTYAISFGNLSHWRAKIKDIKVKEDTYVKIGLEKMTTVKGSVNYTSTVLSYDINKKMGGLNVIATDVFGKTYSTRTADDGTFVLYVPKGKYTFSLVAPGIMQYVEVKNNNMPVHTDPKTIAEIDFEITVKQ